MSFLNSYLKKCTSDNKFELISAEQTLGFLEFSCC